MRQLGDSHIPINKSDELPEHPAPQCRVWKGIIVNPVPLDEPTPSFMKELDIDHHSGYTKCRMPEITGNRLRGFFPQTPYCEKLSIVVFAAYVVQAFSHGPFPDSAPLHQTTPKLTEF